MLIPGDLHIHDLVLDLLDDAVLVAVRIDLLQGYNLAGEGSMGSLVEAQENLPERTLAQL